MKAYKRVIQVIDNGKQGIEARKIRKREEVSLRKMAMRMGISAAYLSDLELGRRAWSEKLIKMFSVSLKGK